MAEGVLMATLNRVSPCAWSLCPLGTTVYVRSSEGVPSYCQGNSISGTCGNGGEAEFQLKAVSDVDGKITITSRGIMDHIISCTQTLLPLDMKFILKAELLSESLAALGLEVSLLFVSWISVYN